MSIESQMAALEYVTKDERADITENQIATIRERIASVLFDIPDPAAQTAALQLLKSKIVLDKSFGLCLGLVGLAILEEMF